MILSGLFQWFFQLFSLVEPLSIPNVEEIAVAYNGVVDIVVQGVSMLRFFAGDFAILSLSVYLLVVGGINVFYMLYQLVWFVILKIYE